VSAPSFRTIASASNPVFKHWVQLVRRNDVRRTAKLVWLEGEHLVQAWLACGRPLVELICTEQACQKMPWLLDSAATHQTVLTDALFSRLSSLPSPTGVAALVSEPQPNLESQPDHDAIYLDRVQDPGNLGSLLRSASAVGVNRVFLSPESASAWSAKALRAGMGAQFLIDVIEPIRFDDAIAIAPSTILAAHPHASHDLYATNLCQPCLWVFGSEGAGVSPSILAHPGVQRVAIAQRRQQESLNVAMAATVCLFEQQRQRLAVGSVA
jgi:TrmH family RNA methyltransferase